MDRTQFTFYISFYSGIQDIEDPLDRLKMYDAICEYALFEKEPDLPKHLRPSFKFIQPNLDSGRKKAERGARGGKAKQEQGDIPCLEDDESKGTSLASSDAASKEENKIKKKKETKKESEGKEEKEYKSKASTPAPNAPTLPEVVDYFKKMGLNGDPNKFFYHHQSKGWEGITDWQAAAMKWSIDEKKFAEGGSDDGIIYSGTRYPAGVTPQTVSGTGKFELI